MFVSILRLLHSCKYSKKSAWPEEASSTAFDAGGVEAVVNRSENFRKKEANETQRVQRPFSKIVRVVNSTDLDSV